MCGAKSYRVIWKIRAIVICILISSFLEEIFLFHKRGHRLNSNFKIIDDLKNRILVIDGNSGTNIQSYNLNE